MTTTNDAPDIQNFDEFKSHFAKEWAKLAKERGQTPQELTTNTITAIITSIMFGRAARKGNVAKTIYWGVGALQISAYGRSRREAAERKREARSHLASVTDVPRPR